LSQNAHSGVEKGINEYNSFIGYVNRGKIHNWDQRKSAWNLQDTNENTRNEKHLEKLDHNASKLEVKDEEYDFRKVEEGTENDSKDVSHL
jgi:hypothetical protein